MRMNKARLQVAEDFWELEASALVRNVAQWTVFQTCLKQLTYKIQLFI
jgi:hypothetical protein